MLSHVPLSKYHRPTHHHLLACVTSVVSALLDPPLLCEKICYSMLTSHPGYVDDVISLQ